MTDTISLTDFDFENTTVNLYMISFKVDLQTGKKIEDIITIDGLKIDRERLSSDLSNVNIKDIRLYIKDYYTGMKLITPGFVDSEKKIGYYYLKNWITDEYLNVSVMTKEYILTGTFFANSLCPDSSIESVKMKFNNYLKTLATALNKASEN